MNNNFAKGKSLKITELMKEQEKKEESVAQLLDQDFAVPVKRKVYLERRLFTLEKKTQRELLFSQIHLLKSFPLLLFIMLLFGGF